MGEKYKVSLPIVEMSQNKGDVIATILMTKRPEDYGIGVHKAAVPIVHILAYAFLYLIGHAEREKAGN